VAGLVLPSELTTCTMVHEHHSRPSFERYYQKSHYRKSEEIASVPPRLPSHISPQEPHPHDKAGQIFFCWNKRRRRSRDPRSNRRSVKDAKTRQRQDYDSTQRAKYPDHTAASVGERHLHRKRTLRAGQAQRPCPNLLHLCHGPFSDRATRRGSA
jgi:hypothetical protein